MKRRAFLAGISALCSHKALAFGRFGTMGSVRTKGGAARPPIWAHVQGTQTTGFTGTSGSLAFSAPVGSGNIVVGSYLANVDNALLSNVTDDKGNAYVFTNSGWQPGGNLVVVGFRSAGPIMNGAKTLSFTYPTGGLGVVMDELTAGFPLSSISLDGSQLNLNNTNLAFPNFQTTRPNDLLYAVAFFSGSPIAAGSGWTLAQGGGTTPISQWKQQISPSGNTAASFGGSANVWATVFAINATPRSSWELRQSQIQRSVTNATSGSVSFPNTVAPGSIVIGTVSLGTTTGRVSHITSIVDDKSNAYQIIPNSIDSLGRAMFWSNGAVNNGPKTITCNCSVTETLIYFVVNEFLPPPGKTIFAIDGTPSMITNGTASTSFTSGTVTTAQAGDLIYSEADMFGSLTFPSNSFSSLNGEGMTWTDAFFIQQAAGTIASQWSCGSGAANTIGIVAISASSGTVVTSVNLSGTSLTNLSAHNQGQVIGAITVTTSPPGGIQNTPVVLGGTDAALFSVTNGGTVPCNLIAAVDIPSGSYSITLSAA
jgi:hypothetical protein